MSFIHQECFAVSRPVVVLTSAGVIFHFFPIKLNYMAQVQKTNHRTVQKKREKSFSLICEAVNGFLLYIYIFVTVLDANISGILLMTLIEVKYFFLSGMICAQKMKTCIIFPNLCNLHERIDK